MSNEALTEAIAKAIFIDAGFVDVDWEWEGDSSWAELKAEIRSRAQSVMACPELIAALAPPAPHIVGVDGYEALPEGSVFLDSRNGVHVIRDKSLGHTDASRALLRDLAPFTVLHVGGAE